MMFRFFQSYAHTIRYSILCRTFYESSFLFISANKKYPILKLCYKT